MKHISHLLLLVLLLGLVESCGQPALTSPTAPLTSPTAPLSLTSEPSEKTATGFYWPTGTSQIDDYAGWLSDGCSWSGNHSYYENEFHIGKDIAASEGDPVYAIADGRVLYVSSNGWGLNNIALLVVHSLSDGSSFTAVYGHIRSDLKQGDPVEAGKPFARVGPWRDGSHLHFGIHPGTSIKAPYGRMPCPPQGPITDYNDFVDPIKWITTRSPGREISATIMPTPVEIPTPTLTPTAKSTPQSTDAISGKIAFFSDRDSSGYGEIYLINPDGSAQTRLTSNLRVRAAQLNGAPDVVSLRWSAAGRRFFLT